MATALVTPGTSYGQGVSDLATALAHPGGARTVTRSVSLAELGVDTPILLDAQDSRRDLYLPVPVGLPIHDATLQFDGKTLDSNGSRATLLLSLDGSPVLSRAFTQARADASASIGVDGSPRASGFVLVGLAWSSNQHAKLGARPSGNSNNVLQIAPTTRLTYQFDPHAVTDLRTAESALPAAPVVTVGAGTIAEAAFDAGWRTEAVLQRDGKKPVAQAWPIAGDTITLDGNDVPAPLRTIPAFAALTAGGEYRLADPAQAGALVMLAPPAAFAPDVIVVDDSLRNEIKTELDALRAQIVQAVPADTAAAAAFDAWRARAIEPIVAPLAAGEVRLAPLSGHVVIVVGDKNGVATLAHTWVPIDVEKRFVVHRFDNAPLSHGDAIALTALGGEPRSLSVIDSAIWDMSFDLARAAAQGKLPGTVVLDVTAAPTPRHGGQIASVFFNDVLIGSQLLNTNGKPQRITARVPRYALARANLLSVMFQRQPAPGLRTQGYPVAVLPSSHLRMRDAGTGDNFITMIARFASDPNVLLPSTYLDHAASALTRVASLANAVGIAPTRGSTSFVNASTASTPSGPFLAIDVALRDEASPTRLSRDHLMLTDARGHVLTDISGLNTIGIIEVATSGTTPGVVYRTLGVTAPLLPASLRLSQGDIAIVGAAGVLKAFDTQHPRDIVRADGTLEQEGPQTWLRLGVPGALFALFLTLLVAAGIARRRRRSRDKA